MNLAEIGGGQGGGQVIGIGTDIIEVERIASLLERHEDSFLDRVFTAEETRYCSQHKASSQHFAGRWAAKEAALKALGTGWAKGIQWTDIEVTNLAGGAPQIELHGAAREHAAEKGIREMKISISHCKSFAVACVIALG